MRFYRLNRGDQAERAAVCLLLLSLSLSLTLRISWAQTETHAFVETHENGRISTALGSESAVEEPRPD